MNTENGKTSDSNRYRLYFTDKLDLRENKTISLVSLYLYYTLEHVKAEYKNSKFKITAPTWDEAFDLPDGSYTIASIQDYFLWIIKKHEPTIKSSEKSPILIYPNIIKTRTIFKIKTGYKLHMLTIETMDLLGDAPIVD